MTGSTIPPSEIARIAEGLTQAQRDIILGHLVDIPPDESDQLESMALKGEMFFEWVRVRKVTWPITPLGLSVRSYLLSQNEGSDNDK